MIKKLIKIKLIKNKNDKKIKLIKNKIDKKNDIK